jgi:hypothetical protein
MTLLLRTFRPKCDEKRAMIATLQSAATRMVRNRQTEAVLICKLLDAFEGILWIESYTDETGHRPFVSAAEAAPTGSLVASSAACHLRFVDGFYRFPLPPCQVWWLQAKPRSDPHHREWVRGLREVSGRAAVDGAPVGFSLYRSVDEPSAIVGFLALTPGVTPNEYFKTQPAAIATGVEDVDHEAAWRPLSVIWSVGRLSAIVNGSSPVRYPRTAFWARAAYALPPVSTTARNEKGAKRAT